MEKQIRARKPPPCCVPQSVHSVFSPRVILRGGVGVQRGRGFAGGALGAEAVVRPGVHVRVRRRPAPGARRAMVRNTQKYIFL